MPSASKTNPDDDDATAAAAAMINPPPDHRPRTRSRTRVPGGPPPPPSGGGATNPKPPDEAETQSPGGATNPKPPGEATARSPDHSQDSQDAYSPSLLTPSSLEGDPGFSVVTMTRGQPTTPPHAAEVRPTVPTNTLTRNSYAALQTPHSPTPSDDGVDPSDDGVDPTATDPNPVGTSARPALADRHRPDVFLATFLDA